MVPRGKVTRAGPWKSLGPGEGKVVVGYPFFWWKGENGMGEKRWAGVTESYDACAKSGSPTLPRRG